MRRSMRILDDTKAAQDRYAELLDASPTASVYQTIDWLRVFESLGHDVVLVEVDSQTVVPFLCKGKGTLRRAFSLPYDTYGGPVSPEPREVSYGEVVRTLRIPSVRLVDFTNDVSGTSCRVDNVRTHLVDLDRSYEAVFDSYSRMNRRAIKQAFKRGLRVTVGHGDRDVAAFYRLYRRTLLRYRTPPLPLRFFQSIDATMVPKGLARFYLAWHGDRAVAGNLVLRYKNKAYDWTWGYDKRHLYLRPTNALIDRAIQDEIREGSVVLNLGTSPVNSNGNVLFKENFGATEYPYRILSHAGLAYRAARLLKKGLRLPVTLR